MLQARPTRFHRRLLALYFTRLLRRRFSRVLVRHPERLAPWQDGRATRPLILAVNHSSWWDAVLPIVISCGVMRHDAYGMMEERQLARYRFFTRAGMFSVDRDNARAALASLEYAAALLRGTGRVLWMFPQGKIVPNDVRPIVCESGIGRLVGMIGECCVIPVAFRYEVGREELPVACINVGKAIGFPEDEPGTITERTAAITVLLECQADKLRDMVLGERWELFSPLLHGRLSISERWARATGIANPGR